MRPLFGELALPVDQIVEEGSFIRAKPGEDHLIVRGNKDIHIIDLDESELPDRAAKLIHVYPPVRPRAIKALRRQCDASCFIQCEMVLKHLIAFVT
jgi:hypothetical protein